MDSWGRSGGSSRRGSKAGVKVVEQVVAG
jgi:hypothetical protein